MGWLDELLTGREPRTPRLADDFPAELRGGGPALYTGPGSNGLEVLGCEAASRPTAATVRRAHRARRGNRASPVLIAVRYPADTGEKVVLCGPDGEQPPVHHDIEPSVAGRICAAALDEPNHHAAVRLLRTTLDELDGLPLPGVRNQGLFATHVLRRDLPARSDWADATAAANPMLAKRGRELVQALGYTVEALASGASMLTADGHNHAVAVFCAETDTFESPSSQFYGNSPVAHAFALADKSEVPWVIATRVAQIRLYAARLDTGVGRKGRAETYLGRRCAGPGPSPSTRSPCGPSCTPPSTPPSPAGPTTASPSTTYKASSRPTLCSPKSWPSAAAAKSTAAPRSNT